ncbi:MAG: manganese efflux pump MntP family protein [Armatimonadota bacterium]
MDFLSLLGIAFGLAIDAFAVAIASSVMLRKVSPRQIFRLSFHFGLFQALMPVIGWLVGFGFQRWVAPFDHWIAFGLLAFIGGKAIWAAVSGEDRDEDGLRGDPTRGLSLVMLSLATSIDALAVGISFAMLKVKILYPSAIIGVVACAMTILGMQIGGRLGMKFGRRMEVVGGLVLISIGVKIVLEHTMV